MTPRAGWRRPNDTDRPLWSDGLPGVSQPLSVYVDLYGTGQVDEPKLEAVLADIIDLSPRGILEHLSLNRPIYGRTAAYGHFGRQPDADGGFSWERVDLVDRLKSAF